MVPTPVDVLWILGEAEDGLVGSHYQPTLCAHTVMSYVDPNLQTSARWPGNHCRHTSLAGGEECGGSSA